MECIISISQTFLLDVKRLRKKYKSIISDLDKFKEEISANMTDNKQNINELSLPKAEHLNTI